MAGVFPHMFIAFALLDASLAVGACWLMHRESVLLPLSHSGASRAPLRSTRQT
jgi:hypothetical protein